MSNTRHANNDGPIRQERYASAPEFSDYLKASAVARKCSLLDDPAHKEICLWLQHASMQPGGLAAVAEDFLKRYDNRIGSRTMRKQAGRKIFDAETVRIIRNELVCGDEFLLKGEIGGLCELFSGTDEIKIKKAAASRLPNEYPAHLFSEYCMDRAADELKYWLTDLCLNPETRMENPPCWFSDIEQALKDYIEDRRLDRQAGKIVTSIGAQINDALDYAFDEKCMVHINGVARMGKTFQVQQWCRTYPGRVRYVQVPSGNDDISFFRAIARALGTAAGSAMNTTQIKRQVEDAIQDAGIMLIFDEAHYLFPQYKDARNAPRRINWVLTEVVNKGISVALVTTPQFDFLQKTIVTATGWASEQLDGRISYRLDLPATLPESDLAAIAKFNLPSADRQVIDGLCAYAQSSGKFIAGIEAVAKRARFLAKRFGRDNPNKSDLVMAMKEVDPAIVNIKPTQGEETEPSCKPSAKARKRSFSGVAPVVQVPGKQLVAAH